MLANNLSMRELEDKVLYLKGKEWQSYTLAEKEKVVEECFRYWRARGFPYYRLDNAEKSKEYTRLKTTGTKSLVMGNEIQVSTVGLRLANVFHPQMWNVRVGDCRTPMACFQNDAALRKLIRKAFQIWSNYYSVNESNLRRMLKTYSHTAGVSNFRPTAAKAIYENYSKDGDRVLDFSAGYGGRLLGCMPLDRRYIGIDPCRNQIKGLKNMKTNLEKLVEVKAKIDIHQACAEDFMPELKANSTDLIFSSPPYFNNERYSNESTQSYIKFPEYDDWLKGFLAKILDESCRILKPRGYLILNVADIKRHNLSKDTLELASARFVLVEELKLRLAQIPYLREKKMNAYKYESIFVFKKRR